MGSWMSAGQRERYDEICLLIDGITSERDFYRVMDIINSGKYSVDVVTCARVAKSCYNSLQYRR